MKTFEARYIRPREAAAYRRHGWHVEILHMVIDGRRRATHHSRWALASRAVAGGARGIPVEDRTLAKREEHAVSLPG